MITREVRGDVAVVRLDHGKVNAFDTELLQAFVAELGALEHADTTSVVLTGAGASFSAGVDLRRLADGGRDYIEDFLPAMTDAFFKAFTFPRPIVAAINGHAIAGGCVLACTCDVRLMAEGRGRIGTPELFVGVPFPTIAIEALRLVVPADRLQRVVYLGQSYLPDEALAEGLVDEVVPSEALLDRAVEVAARLGRIPRPSFALTKRLIRQPGQDRVVRYTRAVDSEVLETWASPAVQAHVRAYVDSTLKKR